MSDAVRAEWSKLRSLPSTAWLLAAAAGLSIVGSAIAAAAWHVDAGSSVDPTRISLTGIEVGQAAVAVLAVLVISEEYGTGMIRTSLSAMPRRLDLLAAKAANLAGLLLPVGVVAVAGSLLAGRLLLPSAGIDPARGYPLPSLGQGATLRAATGSVCYLILISLFSLGVATIVRDTAASVGAVLGLIYLPPVAAQLIHDPTWRRHLEQIGLMTAGLAVQATSGLRAQPIGPWDGLGVAAAWALVAVTMGAMVLRRRDA